MLFRAYQYEWVDIMRPLLVPKNQEITTAQQSDYFVYHNEVAIWW